MQRAQRGASTSVSAGKTKESYAQLFKKMFRPNEQSVYGLFDDFARPFFAEFC